MQRVSITINGERVEHDVDPRTLLVQFIREQAGLTGTHQGCDTAQCGACTVTIDGRAVKSCSILAVQAQGARVTTIEGIGTPQRLHPVQQAFKDCHGLQCGFCTPGMVMASLQVLRDHPDPTVEQVQAGLDGNICRCTGYNNIIQAILQAAPAVRALPPSA